MFCSSVYTTNNSLPGRYSHLSRRLLLIVSVAEDNFYFHLLMDRWGDDRVWPIIRDACSPGFPMVADAKRNTGFEP